jgi:hypothetical protein
VLGHVQLAFLWCHNSVTTVLQQCHNSVPTV